MKKVLILILAYNAERHIVKVLDRLPEALWNSPHYQTDVVVIDDCSKDETSRIARARFDSSPYSIRLLRNKRNQGYGGNQKVGYTYAIEHGYDAVVMLHGDGQYPPEKIPDMIEPLIKEEADAVFGSRMMFKKDALAGHMPYYKFLGNIVLTQLQNWALGTKLTEFHTGFRAYSVAMLRHLPFHYNSNVFHFDTDIIIQIVDNGFRIKEIAVPTHYGDEVCHVNGMRYALDVLISTFLSRIQKFGIFYAPKFDYMQSLHYDDKTGFASSHSFALSHVPNGARVLDIGGGEGYVAAHLRDRGCVITGCDWRTDHSIPTQYDKFLEMNLNYPDFAALGAPDYEMIMLLDVIEHLLSPEHFLSLLYAWCEPIKPRVIVTVPNIAFIIPRIMLFFGQFNYGRHGTLDMTHTRLFTAGSVCDVLTNAGFNVLEVKGIPAPFPLALRGHWMGNVLLKLNEWFIKLSKSLFSYQIAVIAEPRPTLASLVDQAVAYGAETK